jgi:hypothetical protein
MKLTNEDFMRLFQTSMEWGVHWGKHASHFDPKVQSYEWRWAYWFDLYANLLFGRQFLEQEEFSFEVVWDEGSDAWLLLTNYESFESKGDEVEKD